MEGPKTICVSMRNAVNHRLAGMRSAFGQGMRVATENRNATMVALLIACMTLAAAGLLWLEPPSQGWDSSDLLMAADGHRITSVVIEYAAPGDIIHDEHFTCMIFSESISDWRPAGPEVRLLVVDESDGARLDGGQERQLLRVLGNISQSSGLAPQRFVLHPDSNSHLRPELPGAARDLTRLLERKGAFVGHPR